MAQRVRMHLHVLTWPAAIWSLCLLYVRFTPRAVCLNNFTSQHHIRSDPMTVNHTRWVAYHFSLFQKLLSGLCELVLQQKRIYAFVKIARHRVLRRHLHHALSGRKGRERNFTCGHVRMRIMMTTTKSDGGTRNKKNQIFLSGCHWFTKYITSEKVLV